MYKLLLFLGIMFLGINDTVRMSDIMCMIICILFIIFTVYKYSYMIFYTLPVIMENSGLHFMNSLGLGDNR